MQVSRKSVFPCPKKFIFYVRAFPKPAFLSPKVKKVINFALKNQK